MNLDIYGGAFRCLLRIRENSGLPVMSDHEFATRFLPGETDATPRAAWDIGALRDMVLALGLGTGIEEVRGYDAVLEHQRAGHTVLVRLKGESLSLETKGDTDVRITLIDTMTPETLTVWCPLRNGSWELLPPLSRSQWETVQALGIVLRG